MSYYMPVRRRILGASPLPRPRSAIHHRMIKIAAAVGGVVDLAPGRYDPLLDGCLLLPQAQLVIAATACLRPLLADEARKLIEATGYDLLLLRFNAYEIDYDLLVSDHEGWLERYTSRTGENGLEFVGDTPRSPIVRASIWGLMTCHPVAATASPASPETAIALEGC